MPEALVEAFDPEALDAPAKPAKSKPKRSTAASKAKPKSAPTDRSILTNELERQAERIVAAYQLLGVVEQRSEQLHPGAWRLSIAERGLLQSALPWLIDEHAVARELKRTRAAVEARESGATDEQLLRLAPKPLCDHVADSLARSNVPRLETELRSNRCEQATAESTAARLERIATLYNGDNANMYADLSGSCPAAISKAADGRSYVVDPAVCLERAAELQTVELPKLKAREQELTEAIEAETAEAQQPLRDWAERGELTVATILGE